MIEREAQFKLMAYLDGELSEPETVEVREWLARDEEARALLAELQNTGAVLAGFEAGLKLPQLFQGLKPIDSGHQQVEEHEVGAQTFLHLLHGFFPGARSLDFIVVHFEQGANVPQHSRFVVDQQNLIGCSFHLPFP